MIPRRCLTGLLLSGTARAACRTEPRATVPVRVRGGFPFVPATLGGVPVTLLLDTGAQGMLITPDAARRLGLPPDSGVSTRILGTGGAHDAPNVILRGLRLGGAPLPDRSAPVSDLPGVPGVEPPLAGLLGAPLLTAYDVDLDVPAGRMALHDAVGCAGAPPGIMEELPLEVTPAGEALMPVTVNGQTLLAVPDTGSRGTIVTDAAAARLGLRGPVAASTARGIDGLPMPLRYVRLRELRVGRDVTTDMPASVAPVQLGRGDMLLGLDWLGRRRMWISYESGRVGIGAARG